MNAAHPHDVVIPRVPLMAIGLMLAATIAAVATWRLFGPAASLFAPAGQVVAERTLRFEDRDDGGIVVRNGADDRVVRVIEPGADPFVRGALRALARERRSWGQGAQAPFRLVAWANGRLSLIDTSTQRRLDIESFGPTQAAAFARLLDLPAR
jgi:putative photosynthetic complex assembly protein